jgi:urease accessory protein
MQMPADGRFSPAFQRTYGRAAVALGQAGGKVRLTDLHQSGSAKAMLPRVHGPVPEVVFLNTSGGLTGGDRIAYELDLGPGAVAVATTQTAERAYASAGGQAEVSVHLTLGAGARLDWLPQETILFEGSALARRTQADLAQDARLVMTECVVLGRAAMGEVLTRLDFRDWREVRRNGVPVLIEPLALTAAVFGERPACLGAARALATVALIAPGAEDVLPAVRAVLSDAGDTPGLEAAASGWDGKCVVRVIGADLFEVKKRVAQILGVVRGCPLPRVWQM